MSSRFPHPFKEVKRRYLAMIKQLPILVSNEAVLEFDDNFDRQGFNGDAGLEAWAARKSKRDNIGRSILIKSGRLRRGNRAAPIAGVARVINRVKYAAIHNTGGVINHPGGERILHFKKYKESVRFSKKRSAKWAQKVNVGSYKIIMPKRQYMGNSRPLFKRIEKLVAGELRKILP